jgi:deoxyribonuclease V
VNAYIEEGNVTVHTDTPPDGWAWPEEERELIEVQQRLVLAAQHAVLWQPPDDRDLRVAAFFIGHARGLHGPGDRGDPAWVGAAGFDGNRLVASAVTRGEAGWPYIPGLLVLREGRLLAGGLESLKWHADLLLVNATGADHPRRSGLALHLGAAAGLPSVGVTDRPLISQGAEPGPRRGDSEPLVVEDEVVGYRLRTRAGVRPICVHAAWRTTPELARDAVLRLCRGSRTPEPLRHARRLARQSRA